MTHALDRSSRLARRLSRRIRAVVQCEELENRTVPSAAPLQAQVISNDTYYTNGSLWGMYGDASPLKQNQYGSQAAEAWNAGFVGSRSVYVGIIDEGFQWNHPDLAANTWVNPGETAGDGIDNDGNGYIDDIKGWDFFRDDNSVYDGGNKGTQDAHGTHVAGTIGALGGNGIGVAGVNWEVTMISAKFLGPAGGYISDAVDAINYLVDLKEFHGVDIVAINNSWGGGGHDPALYNAIKRAGEQGILFVVAASNEGKNNDTTAVFPAEYSRNLANVITVAALQSNGNLASFSNYGQQTVHLAAPGASIVSTVPKDKYASYSGTSMATPHVTGAIALYKAQYPDATAAQIKDALQRSVAGTTSQWAGKTIWNGRLDVSALLNTAPNADVAWSSVEITPYVAPPTPPKKGGGKRDIAPNPRLEAIVPIALVTSAGPAAVQVVSIGPANQGSPTAALAPQTIKVADNSAQGLHAVTEVGLGLGVSQQQPIAGEQPQESQEVQPPDCWSIQPNQEAEMLPPLSQAIDALFAEDAAWEEASDVAVQSASLELAAPSPVQVTGMTTLAILLAGGLALPSRVNEDRNRRTSVKSLRSAVS